MKPQPVELGRIHRDSRMSCFSLPVIALVGRPNVGKSTLFNVLTRSRDALVADEPGLTRDRQYGRGQLGQRPFLVVDTGGLSDDRGGIHSLVTRQAWVALEEADAALFLVDARSGVTAADENIAERLRGSGKRIHLVVNKTDGLDQEIASADFHHLGLTPLWPISASHKRGIRELLRKVLDELPWGPEDGGDSKPAAISIAIVGRPNVGKSTLVNRMLGEERVLAFDRPGTTRDSIFVPFEKGGKAYVLIDTAGIRRRARVSAGLEKFSVIKALQAMENANVVIMVLDARDGVTDQDAHLLGYVLEAGRALVIAANKWDGLEATQRQRVRDEFARRIGFIDFAPVRFISALHGSGVGGLFSVIDHAWESASRRLATSALTRVLEDAVAAHPPPVVRGRRIKLRYAHQGGQNPPIVVIHGSQTEAVPDSYGRYLAKTFRQAFQLDGTPVKVEFRTGGNPYEGRRNRLTPRQHKRRKRLIRHARKS